MAEGAARGRLGAYVVLMLLLANAATTRRLGALAEWTVTKATSRSLFIELFLSDHIVKLTRSPWMFEAVAVARSHGVCPRISYGSEW